MTLCYQRDKNRIDIFLINTKPLRLANGKFKRFLKFSYPFKQFYTYFLVIYKVLVIKTFEGNKK